MMMVPKLGLLIGSIFDLYYKCKKTPMDLPRHGKILLYSKLVLHPLMHQISMWSICATHTFSFEIEQITVALLVIIGLVNTGLVFSTGAVGTSIVSNVSSFIAMVC